MEEKQKEEREKLLREFERKTQDLLAEKHQEFDRELKKQKDDADENFRKFQVFKNKKTNRSHFCASISTKVRIFFF